VIVSFQKTVEAIQDGTKTVTRRFWQGSHAAKFKPGMIVDAWTAGPHRGGEFIRKIRITEYPYRQSMYSMTDEDFEREGGARYWKDKEEFITMMGGPAKMPWVVEFDYPEDGS